MAIIRREYLASVDKFKKPRVVEDRSAIGLLLLRLLLLEPGSDPLHPEMGVGIRRYRYTMEDDLSGLEREIDKQISQYLPSFDAEVKLTPNPDKTLKVEIIIDEVAYELDTQAFNGTISLADLHWEYYSYNII